MPLWSVEQWRARIGSCWCALGRPFNTVHTRQRGKSRPVLSVHQASTLAAVLILLIALNFVLSHSGLLGQHRKRVFSGVNLLDGSSIVIGLLTFVLSMVLVLPVVRMVGVVLYRCLSQPLKKSLVSSSYDLTEGILVMALCWERVARTILYPVMAVSMRVIDVESMLRRSRTLKLLASDLSLCDANLMTSLRIVVAMVTDLLVTESVSAAVVYFLLLISGNVERNPGPTISEMLITDTVHEDDRWKLDKPIDFENLTDLGQTIPKHLGQIADLMVDWDGTVADELGLSDVDRADIKTKKDEPHLQRREALGLWKSRLGNKATYKALIDVFIKAGKLDYADSVCGLFRKKTHRADRQQDHVEIDESNEGGDKKKERTTSNSAIQETPMLEISYPDVANYDRQTVEQFLPGIKVILHVVNDKERAAIVHRLRDPGPINMFSERNKIILGTFGGYKVAVVQTEMGEHCRNELVIALRNLPDVKVILAIGVCWGMPKYNFGDVLVSTIIHSLTNIRLSDEGMIPRSNELDSTKITDNLTNVFIREAGSWNQKFQCSKEGRRSQVITGEMISSSFLINSMDKRDDLIKKYPEKKTIGGEMEGYVAVQIIKSPEFAERKIGVIIIKAVVDYADKDKPGGKKWQFTGAAAAADFAYCQLQATDGKAFAQPDISSVSQPSTSRKRKHDSQSSDSSTEDMPDKAKKTKTTHNDDIKDFNKLQQAVKDIGDWEGLGINLGVKESVMDRLRHSKDNDVSKKRECLRAYYKSGEPRWKKVVDAVATFPIDDDTLARKIAKNHGIDFNKEL